MSDENRQGMSSAVDTRVAARENEEPGHRDSHLDVSIGVVGSHPVGTGVGAAAGGTVGAVVGGKVGGPVGAMIGAAVGGLAGGLAGKEIAESINPTEEDAFWRANYSSRPYTSGSSYDDYRLAYQYGWENRARYADRNWNEVEHDLEHGWNQARGTLNLGWSEARHAARDAWNRLDDRFRQADSGTASWLSMSNYSKVLTSPGSGRPVAKLAVRLPELHDLATGRLDAAKVAEYLQVPLKQLSEALGRNYSTVHRTPSAQAIQESLCSIKRSLVILEDVLGERSSVLAWLNSPHSDLGHRTPMGVLLQGHAEVIEGMLRGALEGIPS